MSELRDRITGELKAAMKAQDRRKTCTLRLVNAAIKDRDIAARSAGKDAIADGEVMALLCKMVNQRQESKVTYEEAGRLDLAEQEEREVEIISEFLPRQLDASEIKLACQNAVAETGAAEMKDMGRAMSVLKQQYPGQMDFARASEEVKSLLATQ
ncbi:MAG: GatB/YqeY domain-containing protein [Pseudomonadota bacterium]